MIVLQAYYAYSNNNIIVFEERKRIQRLVKEAPFGGKLLRKHCSAVHV